MCLIRLRSSWVTDPTLVHEVWRLWFVDCKAFEPCFLSLTTSSAMFKRYSTLVETRFIRFQYHISLLSRVFILVWYLRPWVLVGVVQWTHRCPSHIYLILLLLSLHPEESLLKESFHSLFIHIWSVLDSDSLLFLTRESLIGHWALHLRGFDSAVDVIEGWIKWNLRLLKPFETSAP